MSAHCHGVVTLRTVCTAGTAANPANREGGDSVPSCTPRREGATTFVVALYWIDMTEPAAIEESSALVKSQRALIKAGTADSLNAWICVLILGIGYTLRRKLVTIPKLFAPAFQRPKEIAVGYLVHGDQGAIAENDVVAENVVHGPTILVVEVVESADQGQPGYPYGLQSTPNGVQTIGIQRGIDVDPFVARAYCDIRSIG